MNRTLLLLACIATGLSSQAQTTKLGYALTWDNTLTVVPDTLVNGKHKLPAYTITIHEADAGTALDLWKNEYKAISREVSGSKPVKAVGAVQPTIAEGGIMVMATSASDKKAQLARLTLAFAQNDSVPVEQDKAAADIAQKLAVKYNKAVVQAQITSTEKSLEKATGKESDAQADAAKLDKQFLKANGELKKIKAKQGKVQGDNAKLSGEIAGLEKKFQLTNNPKDLEKLSKMRIKLTNGEASLAKLMKSEAKVQADLNKVEGNKPDAIQEQQEKTQTKEQVQQDIDALKRKLDNIR